MKNKLTLFLFALAWAGLISADLPKEPTVSLGTAENFVILAGSDITNLQSTHIGGNVGIGTPTADISGLTMADIAGSIYAPNAGLVPGSIINEALLRNAFADIAAAKAEIAKRCYDYPEIFEGDLSGQTLLPGVYDWTMGAVINRDVVFHGEADDVWILKVHGPLVQASGTRIILSGGAKPENIYWLVNEYVLVGQNAHMEGILLGPATVELASGASFNGRLLTDNEIKLNNNTITSDQDPRLSITVTANKQEYEMPDEVITYTITVSNTGNVALSNINVSAPLTGLDETISSLGPTGSVSYQQNYFITVTDVYTGVVNNTVTATGFDPDNEPVTATENKEITFKFFYPELILEKSADRETYSEIGEVVTYSVWISNSGTVTIFDIDIIDPLTGFEEYIAEFLPCNKKTFSVPYVITYEDMCRGYVKNTVTSIGLDSKGGTVGATDEVTIIADFELAEITVEKVADQPTYEAVGQLITYTIVVENTGHVAITDLLIADPLTGLNEFVDILRPCTSISFTATYIITEEDMLNGSVVNTATAQGDDPKGVEVSGSDQETITAILDSSIDVKKTADIQSYSSPGEEITYTILVENTGNVAILDVKIDDDLTNDAWTIALLPSQSSETFQARYAVTQQDIDKGSITNTVTAIGQDPQGKILEANDLVIISGVQNPEVTISKSAVQNFFTNAGETVSYLITIENTGNVTLSELLITDNLTGDSWEIASLSPGETEAHTTNYVITQQDVDSGEVVNMVSVAAKDPKGQTVEDSATETIFSDLKAKMSLVKTAGQSTYSYAGEEVSFTIVLQNTGNVTISNITVTDDLTGDSWAFPTMLPGDSETITTSYTVAQGDLDNGTILNMAAATGKDPEGKDVEASAEAELSAIMNPALSLNKSASIQSYTAPDEIVGYTIVVSNTGNVTLNDLEVKDEMTGDSWTLSSLAPGASESFSVNYAITQEDLDAGQLVNMAHASGKDPQGQPVEDSHSITIPAIIDARITVSKTAGQQSYSMAGEVVTYAIVIENTGNVTIAGIVVTDDLTGEQWTVPSLAPGATVNLTATYTITQEDIDRGVLLNTVIVVGLDPFGDGVDASDQETIVADQNAAIGITKTASPGVYSTVGEQISYTIVVENTGNLTLTDIMVNDDLTGESWSIALLLPGEKRTFNTSMLITQELIDLGRLTNTATVSGKGPNGEDVSDSAEVIVNAVNRDPRITIVKTSSRPVFARTGDMVEYTIVVTNAGNVTLRDISVVDNLTNGSWTIAILRPGESQTFQTSYTVNQADIDRGEVVNRATAQGVDPQGNTVSDFDEETAIGIRIPGGLTPDTPFDNILIIRGIEYYPSNIFRIFNRYGTLVYEASPYRNDWVGVPNRGRILTDADGKVPAGTYYYLLELEPGQKPFSGYIYLIKQ